MVASNDSMKKTSVKEADEIVFINGREMQVDVDGTLKPLNKKKRAFKNAAENLREQMPDDRKNDMNLAEFMAMQKQND